MKKSSSFVIFNISKQNKYEEYKEKTTDIRVYLLDIQMKIKKTNGRIK